MQTIVRREALPLRPSTIATNAYTDPERAASTSRAIELALLRGNREEADACLDRHFAGTEGAITLDSPLALLQIPQRTLNGLENEGILTVRQLCQHTPMMLGEMRNFGRAMLNTIREELAQHGFALKNDTPAPETEHQPLSEAACDPGFREHRERALSTPTRVERSVLRRE